jgi:hypothetical protein
MVSGKGLLQCHIYDHISAGMSAIYNVKNLGILEAPADAPVRTYYIAAEPTMWDYAPLGFDGCSGGPWSEDQLTFVQTTNGTMGSQYKKGLFREYTDATFKTRKPHPPEYGILGPIIRAEVGDKIVVHFKNKLLFNASMQLFGGLAPIGQTTQYQVRQRGQRCGIPGSFAVDWMSAEGDHEPGQLLLLLLQLCCARPVLSLPATC